MSNLANRAMLANLKICQWTAHRHDRQISQEVADNHGNDVRLGRFNKSLIDKGALKPVTQAASALREHHYTNTLPWLDTGPRVLPAANYLPYTAKVRELRTGFEMAVSDFLAAYENHIEDARQRLGDLFDAGDYPDRADIAERFSVDVAFEPLPQGQDFRCELGDIEERRIREDIERRTADALQTAHASLWARVHKTVSHMVERLNAYGKGADGKVQGAFRDTLVGNVRELVELLPRLNLTGDPALEAMRQRIERELAQEEPETLRENEAVRKNVAQAAAEILQQMAGYAAPAIAAE